MTYRAATLAAAPRRLPPILGFALYVMGAGCAAIGLGHLCQTAAFNATLPELRFLVRVPLPAGHVMVFAGLVIAWRALRGTSHRRLAGVAATLWAALFVMDLQRGHALVSPSGGSFSAIWVGETLVLGLIAFVVHQAARAFAGRTWSTTLGVSLLAAHALQQAPVAVPFRSALAGSSFGMLLPRDISLGALGFFFFAGGLYAAGHGILRGTTVEESARAPGRGLPLLADASVSLAGVLLAHGAAAATAHRSWASRRGPAELAGASGVLLAAVLLVLAFFLLRGLGRRPLWLAAGALVAVLLEVVLVHVTPLPELPLAWSAHLLLAGAAPLLAAGSLYAGATTLARLTPAPRGDALGRLRKSLRIAAVLIAAASCVSLLARNTADSAGRITLHVLAVLLGAAAFHATLAGAREIRRIEVALAAE